MRKTKTCFSIRIGILKFSEREIEKKKKTFIHRHERHENEKRGEERESDGEREGEIKSNKSRKPEKGV